MLAYLAAHPALTGGTAVVLYAASVLALLRVAAWLAGRPRHRSRHRAVDVGHIPRHAAPRYLPRHEVADRGPVALGAHPDGALSLVHADLSRSLGDEPTVERGPLVGASA